MTLMILIYLALIDIYQNIMELNRNSKSHKLYEIISIILYS